MTTAVPATRPAEGQVLDAVLRDGHPLVIVPSPPGAGKTALVEMVVACAVDLGIRVVVAMPRAEQVTSFLRRFVAGWQPVRVEALLAAGRRLPEDLVTAGAQEVHDPRNLAAAGPGVVVATVDKLLVSVPNLPDSYGLLVVDEAWQTKAGDLDPCLAVAAQALLVGDPGQLPPLVRSDVSRLEARAHRPHLAAPEELLRRFPDALVIPLVATRRLPQDTVDVVQPAFYPDHPFRSAAGPRQLLFEAAGMGGGVDRALDQLAAGASIVAVVLPAAPALGEMDVELARATASVVRRALERRPVWGGVRRLGEPDIGVVDPHRNSGTIARGALSAAGVGADLLITTPEVWQGSERPIIVARHPVVPGRRLSGFDLEPGRFCVATSRHQLGCVIVARDGMGNALLEHRHDVAAHPAGGRDAEFRGWSAHHELWQRMEAAGRVHRL